MTPDDFRTLPVRNRSTVCTEDIVELIAQVASELEKFLAEHGSTGSLKNVLIEFNQIYVTMNHATGMHPNTAEVDETGVGKVLKIQLPSRKNMFDNPLLHLVAVETGQLTIPKNTITELVHKLVYTIATSPVRGTLQRKAGLHWPRTFANSRGGMVPVRLLDKVDPSIRRSSSKLVLANTKAEIEFKLQEAQKQKERFQSMVNDMEASISKLEASLGEVTRKLETFK